MASHCRNVFLLILTLPSLIRTAKSMQRIRSCYSPVNGYIFCSFTIHDQWNFLYFRSWLDSVKSPVKHVELNLQCLGSGTVFLPWPMRARGLKKFHMKNCNIKGYFSEYNKDPIYPDTLSDISMIDCTIETDVNSNIQRTLLTRVSKSYNCGQQTVRSHVMRNISFSFLPTSSPPPLNVLDRAFSAMRRQSKNRENACNYHNLLHLEESKSDSISSIHFEVMTDISNYPNLRTFNFSSNLLTHLPKHLRQWHKHFPALEILDLSNNLLRSFAFEKPKVFGRRKIFFVNLQHNKIADVPRNIASYIDGPVPVIIDLRNNPIKCTYNTFELVKYLNKMKEVFPILTFLTNIKCTLSTRSKKSKLVHTRNDTVTVNDSRSKLLQLFNVFGFK
ncbi:uncharacterized protein LOC133204996 [Saccostrea echinata]|uniref:uncharacterized protein LOC133204996 n=1 Tax=Saccostrea echinata TaxID=191078 RepID=UPI002A80DBEC|nr:uncharacterized protein LOC133204996 [Saccostrea echinata]